MYLAYRFRLEPTATQAKALDSQLETLRRVYNSTLLYWNAKSDAWIAAHPVAEKKARPKLTSEERAALKTKRAEAAAARKAAPPKKKNHNKTAEQRSAEQEKWKNDRYPCLNEVYHFLTELRMAPRSPEDVHGPDPKYMTDSHLLASMMRDTAERVRKAFKRYWEIQSGQITIPVPKKPRKDNRPHGYPRFKRYGGFSSIAFAQYGAGCKLRNRSGKVVKGHSPPSKNDYLLDVSCVGRIKIRVHRAIEGTIKNATVSRDVDGKWYVALGTELPAGTPVVPKVGKAVGIDMGLNHFLVTSDGEQRDNPRYLKKNLPELRRVQRKLSRKQEVAKAAGRKFRGCKNLQKAKRRVANLHVRVRNLRKEHHHEEANRLIDQNATICVEKLNIRGMKRNSKLARSISDAAWGGFLIALKHKAEKAGVRYVEVDPSGTSQTCPKCGGRVEKTLDVRVHNCPHCGYVTNRDHASAQVILARGVGTDGGGSLPAVAKSGNSPVLRRSLSQSDRPLCRVARQKR